jgi:hypothetical protein
MLAIMSLSQAIATDELRFVTGGTVSPAEDASAWLRQTAYEVIGRLSARDADGLIDHARTLREEHLSRGTLLDRLRVAVPLALVPALRQLGVTGAGPKHVWALPFDHVLAAANRCVDLYVPGRSGVDYPVERTRRLSGQMPGRTEEFGVRSLDEWVVRHGLRPWIVESPLWAANVMRAQDAATTVDLDVAAQRLEDRIVVWAHPRCVRGGPRDGAPGLELIFDDAQVLVAPLSKPTDGAALIGGRIACAAQTALVFTTRTCATVALAVSHPQGLVHQPSPVPATRLGCGILRVGAVPSGPI